MRVRRESLWFIVKCRIIQKERVEGVVPAQLSCRSQSYQRFVDKICIKSFFLRKEDQC